MHAWKSTGICIRNSNIWKTGILNLDRPISDDLPPVTSRVPRYWRINSSRSTVYLLVLNLVQVYKSTTVCMYFLLSDVNAPWDFYRAQIHVFEYSAYITRVQIMSACSAAIITESGKICACAGTSSGRYRPRVGNQRYLQVLTSTFFDSQNTI